MLQWNFLVRIDGSVYSMLGMLDVWWNNSQISIPSASIMNKVLTPTRIIFTAVAGPMQVNVTFMNPVEVRFWSSDSFDSTSTYALLSQEIGSSNQYHSLTFFSPRHRWTIRPMTCRCTLTSMEVWKSCLDLHHDLTTSAVWLSGSISAYTSLYYNSVTSNMDAIYHTIAPPEPVSYDTRTGWGTLYYAMKNVSDNTSSISLFTLTV